MTHLLLSEFPISAGQTLIAACGREIYKAEIIPFWDDMATGTKLKIPESTILLCTRCVRAIFSSQEDGPRKVFAVTERKENA